MTTRLVVGAFSPSVLLSISRRTGRLDEQGLEVEEVPVASSPAQFRSLADGELDAAFTSPDNVLAYRFSPGNPLGRLLDARMVSGVDRGMGLALYGRPGLESSAQLRGVRLGVDVPVSGFALAMYALTEHLGVPRGTYELLALGSTPRRLTALLAGECDATMLNAGNELIAEENGCVRLASVADVCPPYLGTVIGVVGDAHLDEARALATAIAATVDDVLAGRLDGVAAEEAATRLDLTPELARRYVARLRSPEEGLVPGGEVDPAALQTLAGLRRRYLPEVVDGADVLDRPLDETSGLLAASAPPSPERRSPRPPVFRS
jgi:ABC-type nitrate/sulfonate/bicarbonate transport system substrate-binding protein